MSETRVPLAGVIGSPIAHSKSPRLHGHWLRTLGIRGHYIPMEIMPDDLESALRMLPKLGFVGLNVTIPYKEKALEIADLVTDRATLIGAANTLIFRPDGQIHADNTDGYGFIQNIRQTLPDWKADAGTAVVLGAGGAARAVLASLLDAGTQRIILSNRTRIRADNLKDEFGKRVEVVDWVHVGNAIEDAVLLVNTTSLGMVGKAEMRIPLDGLRPGTVVSDLVYTPMMTKLLQTAKDKDCRIVDGVGMLLHQAVPGFERWFGVRPEVTEDLRRVVLG
ncbi:shikimate dehydrogenase [Pseudoprimorskyibacter insulae]|uniref:Shikimate dehydrogenase (NADP(+)) n=1 Tax=Pseudoprimorskyibacter insulae TaxID=1695997 RepID=A0A2R8ATQ5_9RHOB|nr:shikimate dehydrogenase [Pseudoprimorskyibacter insulae]SPF79443.1 Shikimate dehydrogenase (NADP(+)) [Pseudoprimorskyibacter insulae]